jgi:hypothetical protein
MRPRSGRATRHSPLPAVRGAGTGRRRASRSHPWRRPGWPARRRPARRRSAANGAPSVPALGHPTRGNRDAELAEQPGDLARRQAQPLGRPRPQRDRAPARSAQDDWAGHVAVTAGSGRSGCRSGRPRSPAVGGEVFLILKGHPELLDLSGEPIALGPHRPELGLHHCDPPAQRSHLGIVVERAGHCRSSSASSRRARRASARAARPVSVMV